MSTGRAPFSEQQESDGTGVLRPANAMSAKNKNL
jgi:hypothetical protein